MSSHSRQLSDVSEATGSTSAASQSSIKLESLAEQSDYAIFLASNFGIRECIPDSIPQHWHTWLREIRDNLELNVEFVDILDMPLYINGQPLHSVRPEVYAASQDARLKAIGPNLHARFCRLRELGITFATEDEWEKLLISWLELVLGDEGGIRDPPVAIACQRGTVRLARSRLGLYGIALVKPDLLLGLPSSKLQIKCDRQAPALLCDIRAYCQKRRVLMTATDNLLDPMWFPFVLMEVEGGNGKAHKARLQNVTSLRIALELVFQLHARAEATRPRDCMPLSPMMNTVYGVRTCSDNVEVVIAVRDVCDIRVTRILVGSLSDSSTFLKLYNLLQRFEWEAVERREKIENWLWCLQDEDDMPVQQDQIATNLTAEDDPHPDSKRPRLNPKNPKNRKPANMPSAAPTETPRRGRRVEETSQRILEWRARLSDAEQREGFMPLDPKRCNDRLMLK
ncbi:uncharacterized protein I303_103140 [Kwoniella dejecticola CBS 10117]|uniref:Uncharacterized protein n=1 Tax=Kwoniella dejecticola CBS 10117 TaxID=1296121 RepID=A0A1A6AAP9_9TREE|nr:uncharacterized protein I303_03160 [Kwoniella dejecticola CBS 10117]OBR87136.1 hypothetical protein I303_03160 [Kwoniella dejecticola CBS 10117]